MWFVELRRGTELNRAVAFGAVTGVAVFTRFTFLCFAFPFGVLVRAQKLYIMWKPSSVCSGWWLELSGGQGYC
jgi:hypothetical protein